MDSPHKSQSGKRGHSRNSVKLPGHSAPGGWDLLVFLLNPIWDREEALLSSESEGACEPVDVANTMPFSPHSILQVNVRLFAPASTKISEKIGGSELADPLSGSG